MPRPDGLAHNVVVVVVADDASLVTLFDEGLTATSSDISKKKKYFNFKKIFFSNSLDRSYKEKSMYIISINSL